MAKPPIHRGPGRSGIAHDDDDNGNGEHEHQAHGSTGATGATGTHQGGATGPSGPTGAAAGGGVLGGLQRLDKAIAAASGLKDQPEGAGIHALLSTLATQFMGVPAQGFMPPPETHQGGTGATGSTGATGAAHRAAHDDE